MRLRHEAVEHAHDFARATGDWDQFAPGADFGNAKGMVPQNVCSNVVFGANHEHGEKTRIGVDWVHWHRIVGHDSVSLH